MVFTEEAPAPKVLVVAAPVPMVELSDEVRVVKAPDPPVMEPDPVLTEANVAAPRPVTDHCASFKTRSEPLDAPIVIVPPAEFPMVVSAVPELLIKVVPATVNPAFPVNSPPAVKVVVVVNDPGVIMLDGKDNTTSPVVGEAVI
jgi:hypothetical protein